MNGPIPAKSWRDIRWPDIDPHATREWIAVLPLAATEQHGPHLPLETDTLIAKAYLAEVNRLVPETLPVTILPIETVGISTEHLAFPGTTSIAAEDAIRRWIGIASEVAERGIRKIVIVTSHGGNSAAMDIVALELRARFRMLAVTTAWARFGYPQGVFPDHEIRHGIHGGDIETSILLASHSDLVSREACADFVPLSVALEKENRWLNTRRPAAIAWMAQDIHPLGVAGNAAAATAEKGRLALAHGARGFVELLQEVEKFDLGLLRAGPDRP